MSIGAAALGALVFVVVVGLVVGAIAIAHTVAEDSPGCGILLLGFFVFILVFLALLFL